MGKTCAFRRIHVMCAYAGALPFLQLSLSTHQLIMRIYVNACIMNIWQSFDYESEAHKHTHTATHWHTKRPSICKYERITKRRPYIHAKTTESFEIAINYEYDGLFASKMPHSSRRRNCVFDKNIRLLNARAQHKCIMSWCCLYSVHHRWPMRMIWTDDGLHFTWTHNVM